MGNLVTPVAIILGSLIVFSAKAVKTLGWPTVRFLFGFSAQPYSDEYNVGRIGYGTPVAERESMTKEAAETETKTVLSDLTENMYADNPGARQWPMHLKLAYLLLYYFALPYGTESDVAQNIDTLVDTAINAHSNGEYNAEGIAAINTAIDNVNEKVSSAEANIFNTIIKYSVQKYIPDAGA